MRKLAFGALVVGVVVACIACGGGGVKLIDGGADAPMACNPIAQTGCQSGEKCTWIIDIDGTATTEDIGHIGCVANGTTANGATCADASATVNGGVDTCVAGTLCIARVCKPICDPQLVDGTAAGACPTNYACSVYSAVFESAGATVAGVCEATCDPLTQKLKTNDAQACGAADPTKPGGDPARTGGTCVRGAGFRSFHCAPTGPSLYTKTDREPPLTDSAGNFFGNGCAPGFIPFFIESSTSMKTLCSGMCAPLKSDDAIAQVPATKDNHKGDPAALGKLPTDAMAIPGRSTCTVGVKAKLAEEDCRFLWYWLAGGDPTKALTTPYNDTLGICYAYGQFKDIMVPGMPELQPEKSCSQLKSTPVPADDPYGSAKDNGCYPLAQSMAARKNTHRAGSFRLANDNVPMVRHVFD